MRAKAEAADKEKNKSAAQELAKKLAEGVPLVEDTKEEQEIKQK